MASQAVEHFDLAIIGSGSGNAVVSEHFRGQRVAVVDEGPFGGTCLNSGCIPTKMYVYTAYVAGTVRQAGRYGVDATLHEVRWQQVRDRIFGRIDGVSAAGLAYRSNGDSTVVYRGSAEFVEPKTLAVHCAEGPTVHLSADRIVIATGAHPIVPEPVRASGVPYYTSADVMRIDQLPPQVLVLGGGYIAAEMASVFAAFGSDVTIVSRGPALLTELDESLSGAFTGHAAARWDLRLDQTITSASSRGARVVATLSSGAEVAADLLLVATGRAPNSALLRLENAGVKVHDDGRVAVDEFGRTSAEGVWALGDVSSRYQLKHVANAEARIVAHNLAHPDALRAFNHRYVPAAVFTEPQIATVGMTQAQARNQGIDFVVASQPYADTAYGWAMEDTEGFCKLIADPATGLLLGAHVFGHEASLLIQPLVQAMSFGQTVPQIAAGQYWIHPALTEVVENALLKLGLS